MRGTDLKDLLRKEGIVLSQLAEDLGMSQQNLSAAFTRDDVKSGLLEKIARVLNRPIGFFYGETFGSVQSVGNNNSQVTQVAGNYSGTPDSNVLEILKIKDEQLLISMRQTTTAQEQMGRLIEKFCGASGAEGCGEI